MAHGIDSLRETNISQHLISSKVSQSPVTTPIDSQDRCSAITLHERVRKSEVDGGKSAG